MSIRTKSAIENLATTTVVTCSCGNTLEVPILWQTVVCPECNATMDIRVSSSVVSVIKTALTWAGVNWRELHCALGDYYDVPEELLDKVREELGQKLEPHNLCDSFAWKCQKCGKCCTSDQACVGNHSKLLPNEQYRLGITTEHLPVKNGHCGFWDPQTKLCTVWNKRPHSCRLRPLYTIDVNLFGEDAKYLISFSDRCPGLLQNRIQTVWEYLLRMGVLSMYFL